MDKLVLQSQLSGMQELHKKREAQGAAQRKAAETSAHEAHAARRKAEQLLDDQAAELHALQLKHSLLIQQQSALQADMRVLSRSSSSSATTSSLSAHHAASESKQALAGLARELEGLEARNASLRRSLARMEESNADLVEQKELNTHTLAAMEQDVRAKSERVQQLEHELSETQASLAALERRGTTDARAWDDERTKLLRQMDYLERGLRTQMDIVQQLRAAHTNGDEAAAASHGDRSARSAATEDDEDEDDDNNEDASGPSSSPSRSRSTAASPSRKASLMPSLRTADRRGSNSLLSARVTSREEVTTTTVVTTAVSSAGGSDASLQHTTKSTSCRHHHSKSTPHSPTRRTTGRERTPSPGWTQPPSPKPSPLRAGSGFGGGRGTGTSSPTSSSSYQRERDSRAQASLLHVHAGKDAALRLAQERVSELEAELEHCKVKCASTSKAFALHTEQCRAQIASLLAQVDHCRTTHDVAYATATLEALESHPAFRERLEQLETHFAAAIRLELQHHEQERERLEQQLTEANEAHRAQLAHVQQELADSEDRLRKQLASRNAMKCSSCGNAGTSVAAAVPSTVEGGSSRDIGGANGGAGAANVSTAELHFSSTSSHTRTPSGRQQQRSKSQTRLTTTTSRPTDEATAAPLVLSSSSSSSSSNPFFALESPLAQSLSRSRAGADALRSVFEAQAAEASHAVEQLAKAAQQQQDEADDDADAQQVNHSAATAAAETLLPLIRSLQSDKTLLEQTILEHVASLHSAERYAQQLASRNRTLEANRTGLSTAQGRATHSPATNTTRVADAKVSRGSDAASDAAHKDGRLQREREEKLFTSPLPIPQSQPASALPAHTTVRLRRRVVDAATPARSTPLGGGAGSSSSTPISTRDVAAASGQSHMQDGTKQPVSYLQQTLLNLQRKQMQRQQQQQQAPHTPRSAATLAAAALARSLQQNVPQHGANVAASAYASPLRPAIATAPSAPSSVASAPAVSLQMRRPPAATAASSVVAATSAAEEEKQNLSAAVHSSNGTSEWERAINMLSPPKPA
jgi:hypothetical protein